VTEVGRSVELSPFITSSEATEIVQKQMDLIKSDQKPVGQAMRDAARQVNEAIGKNLDRDPVLKTRYLKLTGGKLP
jgi:hypothetical protein